MIARIDDHCVGGVTVAYDTPGLDIFEGRSDLAVIWDITDSAGEASARRWHIAVQGGRGLGGREGLSGTKVETQNINLVACRFYERQGCVLRAAHRGVYRECPDEVQLLWYKDLGHDSAAG